MNADKSRLPCVPSLETGGETADVYGEVKNLQNKNRGADRPQASVCRNLSWPNREIDKMSDESATGGAYGTQAPTDKRTDRIAPRALRPAEERAVQMMVPAKAEASPPTVFVLEIDGQPILAFRAATFRQARELGKEDWLQEDLKRMTFGHKPLWDGKSPIRVRRAEPAEEVYYVDAKTENAAGDLPLVYLVQRDDEMDTAGPVTRGSFPPRR